MELDGFVPSRSQSQIISAAVQFGSWGKLNNELQTGGYLWCILIRHLIAIVDHHRVTASGAVGGVHATSIWSVGSQLGMRLSSKGKTAMMISTESGQYI